MDLQLVKEGFRVTRKRKNWVIVFLASGLTCYAAYRFHRSPLLARRRDKIFKFLGAFAAVAEAVTTSAESITVISNDLTEFLQSDSDRVPNSFKQISKIATSEEFSDSLARFTRAVTHGVATGYQSNSSRNGDKFSLDSSFTDQIMDKLVTPAGSGFASAVVGSFARNLIIGFFSDEKSGGGLNTSENLDEWMNLICREKPRELIGDCIQLFISTAVAVYLDKTMNINTYNELFSGLTNPSHESQVRETLVSVSNGAVETLIKTSHQVLSDSNPRNNQDSDEESESKWVSQISSTLAVPSNRKLVLDITGKISYETVRSFMEFSAEKLYKVIKGCVVYVEEAILDIGIEILRHVSAKSYVFATVCLSLLLHMIDGLAVFLPA